MKKIVFLLTLLMSSTAFAAPMIGAKSAGMGGTGRAAVEAVESLYLNPAAIGLMDDFHMGTSYQTGFLSKDYSRNSYGFSATDATPGVLFPASFGFKMHNLNVAGRTAEEQEFRLATGRRLTEKISLGLAGSHIKSEFENGERFAQSRLHLGILVGLMPHWGLSLTADGAFENIDEGMPDQLKRAAEWALGTQYVFQNILRFRWEMVAPLKDSARSWDLAHHFGTGIMMQSGFNLNLGYSVDDYQEQNWSSAGISWEGPRLKVAYSIQQEARQDLGTRHLVDLWLDI